MSLRRERVVAKLVGGLGNQLFIYFAALNLAKKIEFDLSLDLSFIEKSHSSGQSRLDAFHIEGDIIESKKPIKLAKEYRERLVNALSARGYSHARRRYLDEESWHNILRSSSSRLFYLRGFHNTTKHYEELGRPELSLTKVTPAYLNFRAEIAESVALHIRGGDYSLYKDTFGPLSQSYYLSALKNIPEVEQIARSTSIFIFSDDRERSSRLQESLISLGYKVKVVSFAHHFSPAEEMMLISSAKVILMANSTFSFWATEISSKDTIIIAPSNYTRSSGAVDFESSRKRILSRSEWE